MGRIGVCKCFSGRIRLRAEKNPLETICLGQRFGRFRQKRPIRGDGTHERNFHGPCGGVHIGPRDDPVFSPGKAFGFGNQGRK
ncbi:hypothetical protein SDC9_55619 [bioreactor metagenome]|uniref:Uncharacterized protein n=1 Tax=bioreactor metagenome TaxID=1076179 RepID=A0A644X4S5_9ZZZZ